MHFNNKFKRFKNIHSGKTAILFATGPTLNLFNFSLIEEKSEDIIKLGVNSIVFKEDIELDYYFCGHDSAKDNNHLHHINLKNSLKQQIIFSNIKKQIFCATHVDGKQHPLHFDTKDCIDMGGIEYSIHTGSGEESLKKDIESNDLYNHSIVFSALQFILYTGIKKIYLVGCDGGGGFSFLYPQNFWNDRIDWCWLEFKAFIEKNYPEVNIISINPKLLKDFFKNNIYGV